MKPLDQFLQRLRAPDSAGATAIIQRALRDAGLLPAAVPAAPRAPEFTDLNSAPRPAAGAEASASRWGAGSFSCAAGTRRYRLFVPAAAASGACPLVVMLHGCTQDGADFAAGTGMNRLAAERGCIVLYPEQDRGANATGCWNWFELAQQQRGAGEPAILAGLVRHIMAEHDIDPARVFVAGMSAGGAMAAILGAAYPDLFAAVGVHSGLAAGAGKDMVSGLHAMKRPGRARPLARAVPLIVFHGDADAVVHPDNGRAVLRQYLAPHAAGPGAAPDEQSEHGRAGGRSFVCTSWTDSDGRRIAEHWLVHGAAHAWQGGQPGGSHTDPGGPCASRQMLAFFLDRARAPLAMA
jgi:poly(hydroxyalkanoate) depolymerase family esterase